MPLSAADVSSLSRLLDEAIDLTEAQLAPWLAALPAEHAHLLAPLREMLAERTASAGFLATPPRLDALDESVAQAGDPVGPYRLIREIGKGGMGSVWLAERADGGLKRKVALKLPRLAWGAGLAGRMAREREIGALLEHPNISRLYDAGVDERGRPYLALEYIDGQAIDAWCKERALSVRERLELIVQVARAVSYAHGRLVVHRDLKPSNVLVTADGQTHLLDFGIAKLLHEAAAGEIGLTQEQGRVLTPHFASPEQMRGEAITVQSDVYSLGVMVYELLTGSMPYTPKRQTLGALEEAVLEGEPPPAGSRAPDKAAARALRGEVETILAKALKRDPGQRYATVDAFADDIERHLAGERVLAQPDTAWYRLRKSAQRHRVGFAAAAAVLAAVLLGAGVSVVQARRANQEAERARIVKDFVVDVFKVNSRDDPAKNELRQLPAVSLLERGARLIDSKFAGQPRLQAELYGVVGGIFADMASSRLAAQYATRQVEALTAVDASADEMARAMLLLARALADEDRLADAETRARRALSLAAEDNELQVQARLVLARILLDKEALDEAGAALDAVDRSLATGRSPSTALADATALRAHLLNGQGRSDAAEPMFEKAIQIALASEGPLSRRAVESRLSLLHYVVGRSRSAEARSHLDAALATMRALGGPDDVRAAVAQANSAGLLYDRGDMPASQALELATQAQETLARLGPAAPEGVRARVDRDLGWIHLRNGNIDQGHKLLTQAIPVLRASAENPFERRVLATLLGMAKSQVGRHDEADVLFREALEIRKSSSAPQPASLATGYLFVADNLVGRGNLNEAERVLADVPDLSQGNPTAPVAFAREQIAMLRAVIALERGDAAPATLATAAGDLSDGDAILSLRALALCAGGNAATGWPLMEEKLREAAGERYEYSPALARWRALTGLCALDAGDRKRAGELAAAAHQAFAQQPNVSPYFKAPLLNLDRRLGSR